MTKWLASIAFFGGCIAALATGPARAANLKPADANTTGALIYYDLSGNATLDPAEPQNNSTFSHEALLAIYDTLIRLDDAGVPGPGLAESWTRNDDLTTLTMKLRPGVKFHDGTPVNAEAVRRNFERNKALGRRAVGTMYQTMELIESVEVQGDDQITLKLKSPSGQIEYWLASTPGMMVSPAALAGDAFGNSLTAIGAGPYQLKKFDANLTTLMVRNEAYWGGVGARPAEFQHHYVPDGRARLNALRSGQANIALIDARQIPEAKSAGLTVQVVEKNAFWAIYTNFAKGPLGDLRVRRAIMHAIDREGLAQALSFGSANPTEQLWSSQSPFFIKALNERYPFDPKKARALLAEAGFKDGIDLSQLLLNNSDYRQLGEALQANLAESGIRVKFDVVDVSQFPLYYKPPGRGDTLLARYGGRSDPIQTVYELVGTGGSYTPGGSASPKIDALLTQARSLPASDPKRTELMQDLSKEISETAAIVPVMTRANVYAYRPGCIQNLNPYLAAGDERFNDVQIAKECK